MISKDQDEREKGLAQKPAQQSYPLPPWADSSFSSSACEGSLLNTTLLIKGAALRSGDQLHSDKFSLTHTLKKLIVFSV